MSEETVAIWTSAEVERLIHLWDMGYTIDDISQLMDRTMRSIECKVYKLRCKGFAFKVRVGNTKEGRKTDRNPSAQTKCMTCLEYFLTPDRDIHICPECTESGLFNGIAAQYA